MRKKITGQTLAAIRAGLSKRSFVLVGLMGAGKTTIGRRLAKRLQLPFVDADHEIEAAAGMSVGDIFAEHGESHFRDGERKVIARLLKQGPQILATGGGAFMDDQTRSHIIKDGVSIWLKCDLDLLMVRVRKRGGRPLLKAPDPEAVMQKLMDERHPVYGTAQITVQSRDATHNAIVNDVILALADYFENQPDIPPASTPTEKILMEDATTINVALGERAYDIHIGEGLLKTVGKTIAPVLNRPRTVIVTDENLAALHLETLEQSLSDAGIKSTSIVLPAGEATKSYSQLQSLCERLLELEVERTDMIIAFGGGVIGDLTGFAAAILRRGIDFIQIPTSLLAQVDSSVGGKTGINSKHGKNLIGAFHQPRMVIIDIALLDTLPKRQLAAGYAEVAKYGLLGDEPFFSWLEDNASALFAGDGQARITAISKSCQAKADIVARDEREGGVRALLNLGHTFGHALEAATGYGDRLFHGEGVSIGMVLAFKFCEDRKLVKPGTTQRVIKHLSSLGLPTSLSDISGTLPNAQTLVELMRQDKKAAGGKLVFILANDIGDTFVAKDIDESDILAFMARELQNK